MSEPAAAPAFKSGFVALLGRPNAGKSTLMNALLRTKLSIVSPKPQTTRHKVLGLLNGPGYQVCLLDTPGLIEEPRDCLQTALVRAGLSAARESPDLLLLVVEPAPPRESDLREFSSLGRLGPPLILALNKADLPAGPGGHEAVLSAYGQALKPAAALSLSALKGQGLAALLQEILRRLPESPPFYETDQLSDRWERFFAAELIREQVFALYAEEIPHAVAVVLEQFRETEGEPDLVRATLYVERDGQKGILIGRKGSALRRLLARSREALENFLGRPVDLDLWIKVRENWRKDPRALKEFGYLP